MERYNTITENKVPKNLCLLYRARSVLDTTALKDLYFSFIHSYLKYGDIVWANTGRAKLKQQASKQKRALRIVNNEYTDIKEIMVRMKVLHDMKNICELNVYQALYLMFKIKTNTAPLIFENKFMKNHYQY